MKRRILLVLTVCLAFCLLTGGIPTKRFGMGRPFNMAPFGMVDECDANFNPTKISGLVLDLDARYGITTSLTSAVLCSIWADQSGSGRNVTVGGAGAAAVAREPVINSSALNGKPGLVFDGLAGGAGDYLFLDWADAQDIAQPLTIFIICSDPVKDATATRTLNGAAGTFFPLGSFATSGAYTFNGGGTAQQGGTIVDGVFHKIRITYVGSAGNDSLLVDGISIAKGNAGDSDMKALYIGTDMLPAKFADVTVCRILIYNKSINKGSDDLTKLNAYFLKLYGL